MILTDVDILGEIKAENIIITPFDMGKLGSNSYDIHLGNEIATYMSPYLDAKSNNKIHIKEIPKSGLIIYPNELYLATSVEYTETKIHIPMIEGKSSISRLGISIHQSACLGDVGYCGHWAFHINCVKPVRIYAGMPIGQLMYFTASRPPLVPYNEKKLAKYNNTSKSPSGSLQWMNNF